MSKWTYIYIKNCRRVCEKFIEVAMKERDKMDRDVFSLILSLLICELENIILLISLIIRIEWKFDNTLEQYEGPHSRGSTYNL